MSLLFLQQPQRCSSASGDNRRRCCFACCSPLPVWLSYHPLFFFFFLQLNFAKLNSEIATKHSSYKGRITSEALRESKRLHQLLRRHGSWHKAQCNKQPNPELSGSDLHICWSKNQGLRAQFKPLNEKKQLLQFKPLNEKKQLPHSFLWCIHLWCN